jgi:hypothetical protein
LYIFYCAGVIDGFTEAFLEGLFPLRNQNGLNRGKLAVVATTGIGRGVPALKKQAIKSHMP